MPAIRQVFFEPLEQLQAEVESQGGRFLVVLFPCKEELYGARVLPQLLEPIEQTRAELRSRGIPALDLYPIFADAAHSRATFYRNDMHMNAAGHEMTAQALTAALFADRRLQPPR